MMELYCKTQRGLNPDLLDKLFGLKSDEYAWVAQLFLSNSDVPTDAARVFGSLIHKLAKEHHISFLFPYDMGQVKRKLQNLNVETVKTKRGLFIKVHTSDLLLLNQILSAATFTTFYALVNGLESSSRKLVDIFNNLEAHYFICVFSLYDDSIEVLSKSVDNKIIGQVVNELGVEEGIKIIFGSRA